MIRLAPAMVLLFSQVLLITPEAYASFDTIGPNGINSQDLGLTGSGIAIGQVEAERPGKPNFDKASNSNFWTNPAAVFVENGVIDPTQNATIELYFGDPPIPHATWVAGIMIGNDPVAPGVAADADLYASLANSNPMAPGNPNWAIETAGGYKFLWKSLWRSAILGAMHKRADPLFYNWKAVSR